MLVLSAGNVSLRMVDHAAISPDGTMLATFHNGSGDISVFKVPSCATVLASRYGGGLFGAYEWAQDSKTIVVLLGTPALQRCYSCARLYVAENASEILFWLDGQPAYLSTGGGHVSYFAPRPQPIRCLHVKATTDGEVVLRINDVSQHRWHPSNSDLLVVLFQHDSTICLYSASQGAVLHTHQLQLSPSWLNRQAWPASCAVVHGRSTIGGMHEATVFVGDSVEMLQGTWGDCKTIYSFSPNGRFVAACTESGAHPAKVEVYDVITGGLHFSKIDDVQRVKTFYLKDCSTRQWQVSWMPNSQQGFLSLAPADIGSFSGPLAALSPFVFSTRTWQVSLATPTISCLSPRGAVVCSPDSCNIFVCSEPSWREILGKVVHSFVSFSD